MGKRINKSEEIKLRLIWLSCKDIGLLSKAENHILLEKEWAKIKTELRHYFQSYQTSLNSIIDSFKKISLTIDPKLPAGYDAEKDILIWNLWNLFFALVKDPLTKKDCVMSTPAWKLCSELVHEFDHYQFAEENGIIGVSEESRKKFDQKTGSHREKRAFLKQISFLQNSKKKIPFDTPINFIQVKKWLNNGNIRNKKKACLTEHLAPRDDLIKTIDDVISQLMVVITEIDSGQNYDEFSDKENFKKSKLFVKALSLPIKLHIKQKIYPTIELKM